MAEKRLLLELKLITKTPPHTQNPQIIRLFPTDTDESLYKWTAIIAKQTRTDSEYYYNGQWQLDIETDASYPIKPPKIGFSKTTPINHPNINLDTGEICLDILKSDGWSPAWNLQSLVGAILMLLDDPEPDSPLNVDLAILFRHDKLAFESIVQYTIWKHLTLFEGPKDLSGVKSALLMTYDCSNEEEDEVSSYTKSQDKESLLDGSVSSIDGAISLIDSSLVGVNDDANSLTGRVGMAKTSNNHLSSSVVASETTSTINETFNSPLSTPIMSETSSDSMAASNTANDLDGEKPRHKSTKSKRRSVSRIKERVLNRITHQVDEIRRQSSFRESTKGSKAN